MGSSKFLESFKDPLVFFKKKSSPQNVKQESQC